MIDLMAKALVLIALTCIPIGITVGFLTDDKYRNPFVFILILFFTYIGATIWIKAKKEKKKKQN
jgi:ribose/xylose/arabinose/galactoside ABC-type transport system permease subunit